MTSKSGRPTAFKEEYNDQAYKLCLLGATDKQMAEFFGVSEQTLNAWKKDRGGFLESITRGKMLADAKMAESLYHRGLGYSHPEEKIFLHEGEIVRAKTIKHYPPDTPAASLWLRNRQPKLWRDKRDLELSGEINLKPEADDAKRKLVEIAIAGAGEGVDE